MGFDTSKSSGGELLLGKYTPVVETYSPEILYPIPRKSAREALGIVGMLPFYGVDQWHAYEMSWLDINGRPVSRVGRFSIPCESPNLVESKSFKLYLNSLNSTRFESEHAAKNCIVEDITAVAGVTVSLELFTADDTTLAGQRLEGFCLDGGNAPVVQSEPVQEMIIASESREKEEMLYSHLLRSLCPVTGQPDWATVWVHYRGKAIDHDSLLGYIIAYRQHQEFHEQCVERIFRDLLSKCEPEFLHIQAFYTRRGGLDISPFRSTDKAANPQPRLNRQ